MTNALLVDTNALLVDIGWNHGTIHHTVQTVGQKWRGKEVNNMVKVKAPLSSLEACTIDGIKDIQANNIKFHNIAFDCWTIEDCEGRVFMRKKTGKWILKKELVPLPWDSGPLNWDNYDEKTHSEWKEYYHCSNCDWKSGEFKGGNFCSNCGSYNGGEQDDESRSNSNAQTDTRARGIGATDKSSGI